MKIRQSFTLLRQNPFFSVVSIIGTAVSIAFAMVVYMVYDIQTANIRPESHRDRMVYSSYGYSYRKADHSNANTGMSYQAASRVFGDLPRCGTCYLHQLCFHGVLRCFTRER